MARISSPASVPEIFGAAGDPLLEVAGEIDGLQRLLGQHGGDAREFEREGAGIGGAEQDGEVGERVVVVEGLDAVEGVGERVVVAGELDAVEDVGERVAVAGEVDALETASDSVNWLIS